MRSILLVLGLILSLGCSESKKSSTSGYTVNFLDRDLQGLIGGTDWTYLSGKAEEDFSDSSKILLKLYPTSISDICNAFPPTQNTVTVSLPNTVARYDLSFDFSSGNGQTATLYNTGDATNYIATMGAIDLQTISGSQVTGRMDIAYDGSNTLNGNFVATFCP